MLVEVVRNRFPSGLRSVDETRSAEVCTSVMHRPSCASQLHAMPFEAEKILFPSRLNCAEITGRSCSKGSGTKWLVCSRHTVKTRLAAEARALVELSEPP